MALKQASRLVQVSSSLGDNVLLLSRMRGQEALGKPFHYELELVSEDPSLPFENLLGKPLGLSLSLPDGSDRYFHGIVSRCAQTTGKGQFAAYRVNLRPWFWLLTRSSDCKIFQNMKVPDIIKKVFRDAGFSDFDDALSGSYREWEYCVQYRESAFSFVSRLMEQEGIYYYFRHEKSRHVLVLSDAYGAHQSASGYDTVPYYPPTGEQRERDHIYDWELTQEVQPGSYSLNDFDFQRPGTRLEVRSVKKRTHANADFSLYDYPGEYVQSGDGETYARVKLESLQSEFERVVMRGDVQGIGCGNLFKLRNYPRSDQNREYLVIAADYDIAMELHETGSGDQGLQVECRLTTTDAQQPFRSPELTPKPIVQGPQTAIVVGPSGEEIWTDQYGRVKVHFHWDRYDQSDENSSCWIRVSQTWAGKNWGSIHVPRIGQEVIVSFLEGDPDRPIITGRVYNAEQTVPYELPANATQSGVKSRSSKGGSGANYNEIRFEDKKGAEQLLIHAEKNQDIEVENDETHWVGHDRRKNIDHDETTTVKNNRTETVGNNETISIGNDRTENVAKNETISIGENRSTDIGKDETLNVGQNRSMSIGKDESLTVGENRSKSIGKNETVEVAENRSHTIGKNDEYQVGKKFFIDAGDEIVLQTGSASIVMKKNGDIQIKGANITISGSGKIGIKASGDMTLKGSKIAEN